MTDGAIETVMERTRQEEIRLVRFLYADHGGVIRGKAAGTARLRERMSSGIGHTVAMMAMSMLDQLQPVAGMGPVGEVRIVPDPETFVALPYAPGAGAMLADLAVSSAQPVRLDGGKVIAGIFGPARRDGRWVVPENLTVTAMFGEVEVDFTQAILQASRVQLYATVFGGRLRLIVPDGVSVIVSGHMVLGRKRGGTAPPAGPGSPVIEVKALVLGGELAVRTPPKSRRFRLFSRS